MQEAQQLQNEGGKAFSRFFSKHMGWNSFIFEWKFGVFSSQRHIKLVQSFSMLICCRSGGNAATIYSEIEELLTFI